MKFVKVNNIKIPIEYNQDYAINKAKKISGIKDSEIIKTNIIKHSIDARKKSDIKHVYSIEFTVKNYNKKRKDVVVSDKEIKYNYQVTGLKSLENRPVVVGFGPCGMFSAYLLALNGYKPIIIERGSKVEKRTKLVEELFNENKLNTKSNVQFGEGGAGTFSDGKLNTGIKDKTGRIKYVLESFVKFGANPNILYESKPHIGTDVLVDVVRNMRVEIEKLGGEFFFDTALTDLIIEDDKLKAIKLENGKEIKCQACILAIGHSARDTFIMLNDKNIEMESKPFAVGVRIQHSQKDINKALYGELGDKLEPASYKLTYHTESDRGVYSFCMCPGGYVVNASSEEGMLAVNGMSYFDRGSKNANSAIVVTVTKDDFKGNSPLAGMEFQRELEKKAYEVGHGMIPTQRFIEYKNNICESLEGNISCQIKGHYKLANINSIFSDEINDALKEAIEYFGRKIEGFNSEDSLLSAVESRTSSPVRIQRDEEFMSNIKGLYPAGEGAGYAGGITSAAVDGIKIFEAIIAKYKPLS